MTRGKVLRYAHCLRDSALPEDRRGLKQSLTEDERLAVADHVVAQPKERGDPCRRFVTFVILAVCQDFSLRRRRRGTGPWLGFVNVVAIKLASVLPSLGTSRMRHDLSGQSALRPSENLIDRARLGSIPVHNIGFHPHDLRQLHEGFEILLCGVLTSENSKRVARALGF